MSSWTKGVPVSLDVEALMNAFPAATGKRVPYEQVEELVKSKRNTCRFHVVTAAWRKKVFNTSAHLWVCQRGSGFVVAASNERVSWSSGKCTEGIRKVRKAAAVVSTTNRHELDEVHARERDHLMRMTATILTHVDQEAKRIGPKDASKFLRA